MTDSQFLLLKEVLSVPTVTRDESRMVTFLTNYLTEKGYTHYTDHMNNVYVTKGEAEFFPCVIAHTDTVHRIKPLIVKEIFARRPRNTFGQDYNDVEPRLMLTGVDKKGNPSGIGGDDKCGVYTCLRLLEEFDNIKAAFFVSEETGCHGSKAADANFFTNVGYTIQFDAPGNRLVTEVCSFIRLFERDSQFFQIVDATLNKYDTFLYQEHPYTDVSQIKQKFDHACINLSCGYYYMHTPHELVDVEDVERTVTIGKDLIESLGWQKYHYWKDYEAEMRQRALEWEARRKEWEKKQDDYLMAWKKDFKQRWGNKPIEDLFLDDDDDLPFDPDDEVQLLN